MIVLFPSWFKLRVSVVNLLGYIDLTCSLHYDFFFCLFKEIICIPLCAAFGFLHQIVKQTSKCSIGAQLYGELYGLCFDLFLLNVPPIINGNCFWLLKKDFLRYGFQILIGWSVSLFWVSRRWSIRLPKYIVFSAFSDRRHTI